MADRGSNSIFVLISIFFYIQLDVVLLKDPYTTYFEVKADFGIQIDVSQGNNNNLLVTIYSESQSDSAKAFFTGQLTKDLVQSISSCTPIQLMFRPCTTSRKNSDLRKSDETSACISVTSNNDEVEIANFLRCSLTSTNLDQCVKNTKKDEADYNSCMSGSTRLQTCHDNIAGFQNLVHTARDNGWTHVTVINNFKNTLCNLLKDNSQGCLAFCSKRET